ncbi:MAG: hypothetical protein M1830_005886 [Pleopsidium flavum]|nr:MAG: hypothetical protein M1830_005886 [Pleopsidium flavum]
MTGTEYLAAEDKDLRKPTGIGSKQGDLTMAMVFSMTQEGNQNSLNIRTAASTCMAPQVAIKHQKILTQVMGNIHDIAKDRSSDFEAWQPLFDCFEGERITMTWAVCAIRRDSFYGESETQSQRVQRLRYESPRYWAYPNDWSFYKRQYLGWRAAERKASRRRRNPWAIDYRYPKSPHWGGINAIALDSW